jgi:hypothetical protein
MLVGQYGIAFWVPTDARIGTFAGISSTIVSKRGGLAPIRGANLPASTVYFVREYGIDLLASTVLRGAGRGTVLVGGYGILRRRSSVS